MIGIGLDETAVHRHVLALHQSRLDATGNDLLKQLPKQIRLLEPSMPVLGKRGVMRNLLIEAESGEPTPRQMHAQLFHQLPLAGDAVEIADQQHAQQQFRIDRWPSRVAVSVLQLGANKLEVDVAIDQAQQVIFRNLIFEPKVIKQRLPAGMVSHHEQQASEGNGEQQHRELWPAYNPNPAPPQASTERLFQQTQSFALANPLLVRRGYDLAEYSDIALA